jgi:hypothetical protein
LCVRVGEDVVEAPSGSAVFVPRGTPHTYWNPGPGCVRYLLVMTANIYSLIQDIHAMAERDRLRCGRCLRSMNRSCWDRKSVRVALARTALTGLPTLGARFDNQNSWVIRSRFSDAAKT